jgi:hypothetical protein
VPRITIVRRDKLDAASSTASPFWCANARSASKLAGSAAYCASNSSGVTLPPAQRAQVQWIFPLYDDRYGDDLLRIGPSDVGCVGGNRTVGMGEYNTVLSGGTHRFTS